MNNSEIIVRIVKPSDQPYSPGRRIHLPSNAKGPALSERKNRNLFHLILQMISLTLIAATAAFLMVSFFNVGIALKDILIMVGIPVAIGLVAGYAIC